MFIAKPVVGVLIEVGKVQAAIVSCAEAIPIIAEHHKNSNVFFIFCVCFVIDFIFEVLKYSKNIELGYLKIDLYIITIRKNITFILEMQDYSIRFFNIILNILIFANRNKSKR
jgi:hypothetical protein